MGEGGWAVFSIDIEFLFGGGAEKLLEAGNGNGYTTLNVTNAFESYT